MTAPSTQVLLSGALTFGVPLVFAVRELLILRRRPPNGGPPPPSAPKPITPKPLPDCLIPRPMGRPMTRPRILEDA